MLTISEFVDVGVVGASYHYLQFVNNPMEDPELPLYTRVSESFSNGRISWFENSFTVNAGGGKGSAICLTSLDWYPTKKALHFRAKLFVWSG